MLSSEVKYFEIVTARGSAFFTCYFQSSLKSELFQTIDMKFVIKFC